MYQLQKLCIIVDENLQWKSQIDKASKKISKTIGPFVSEDTVKTMYNSFVLPYFDYCSFAWGNCNRSLRDKMQKFQNRANRVITGDTNDIRSSDILKKLNWETLEERIEQQPIDLVNKALGGKCP